MRNRMTIEYLGLWEALYNPAFKPLEFEGFRNSESFRQNLSHKGHKEHKGFISGSAPQTPNSPKATQKLSEFSVFSVAKNKL